MVAGFAAYGFLWFVMVNDVIDVLCYGQMGVVGVAALEKEQEGRWLEAAHRYYYLLEYGRGAQEGLCSADWKQGTRQLPLTALEMRLMGWTGVDGGERVREHDRRHYEKALSKGGVARSDDSGTSR